MSNISQTNVPAVTVERTLGMPEGGPKTLPLLLDYSPFASPDTYTLDYGNMQQRNFMDMVQAIFIDNGTARSAGNTFAVRVPATGQEIRVPSGFAGYVPLVVPNPVKLEFTGGAGGTVYVALLNFPVAGVIWTAP